MWRLFSDVMHDCGVHCIEHTFNYFVCHVVIDAEQNRNIVISILPYRLSYRANVHMKHSLNTFRGTVLSVLLLHSQVCKSHTLRSRGCFSQRLPSSTFKMKPSIAGFTRPHFNWVSYSKDVVEFNNSFIHPHWILQEYNHQHLGALWLSLGSFILMKQH